VPAVAGGAVCLAGYIGVRLTQALLTVLMVLLAVFLIARVAGDPVTLLIGDNPAFKQKDIEQIKSNLGLNDALPVQFGRYLDNALHLDFGTSYRTRNPAMDDVMRRVPATLQLSLFAILISVLIALPVGILSAVRRGSVVDTFSRLFALVGQAAPNFWIGLVLIFVFAVRLHWFPTGGRGGLRYMVLPGLTLGWPAAAGLMRFTRSSMLEVLHSDYVTMARAKGLPGRVVVFKHALRNALIPIVTILGIRLGLIFASSVIVETIFAWPGLGQLFIQAIGVSDFPVIQACVVITAAAVVLMNLVTDLLYVLIDPRIRYGAH
jgi:peptide/nickel transport system permease protein